MSGRTKAALKASASTPRPKSQTMYLTRTRPMMRDRKVDAMRTMVAEKTECACDGRSRARPRAHRERVEVWVGDASATSVDSTVRRCTEGAKGTSMGNPRGYSVVRGHSCGRD